MERILIAENNPALSARLCYEIDAAGWVPTAVYSHTKAEKLLEAENFSLILTELEADGNGLKICRTARNRQPYVPVLLMIENTSQPAAEKALLTALNMGMVDFITKPFSFPVIIQKLKMMLCRQQTKEFKDSVLSLDFVTFTASRNGERIALTLNEFRLLRILTENRGRIVTRQMLLEQLWDLEGNFVDDHTLTVTMTRLRGKLEDRGHRYIRTIRGMGYLWQEETGRI